MQVFPTARSEGLVVEPLDDELLVYDAERERAHSLNAVAAAVWELCDGDRDVGDLAAAASGRLGEPVSEDAVWRALSQLDERRLLVGDLPRRMSGPEFSRRTALARAGLIGASAAFAAPLVKSIVVPTGAEAGFAASCVPPGGQCGTSNGEICNFGTFPPCCVVMTQNIACLPESDSTRCICTQQSSA
jgi:coenzyme PQQ synthesis protein D (PqqD)